LYFVFLEGILVLGKGRFEDSKNGMMLGIEGGMRSVKLVLGAVCGMRGMKYGRCSPSC
jgi:hypothetical protein